MGWHVEYVAEQQTVRACYRGRTTVHQLVEMVESAVQMAGTHHTDRILLDCTSADAALSAAQLYQLPPMFESVGVHCIDRVAIVHGSAPRSVENFTYYGTLAREYGLDHQVFADVLSAVQWLSSFPVEDRHAESIGTLRA